MLFPTAQQHSYRIVQFLQLEFLRAPHLKRSDGADATRRAIGAADIIRMLPGAGRRPSCGFSGQILRQASLYTLPESPVTENSPLAEVAKRLPRAVVCLVSALSYHEITTQIPHEIWLTIPRSSWRPDVKYPPLNLTYVSGAAYSFGIQQHVINGVAVKIYSPAKTVADCFKFRNKVGLDVAIEALREAWRSRKVTMDELVEAAGIDRVSKIMRPYLEATV